jgi:23S rRNA maturation-related 3'-5' exoribonuclease YhaM
MEHAQISHQNVGDKFSGVYYLEQIYIKKTVQGRDYTDMVLRDKSGSRNVKFWGVVKDLEKKCFAFVSVEVEDYQGNPSFIARNLELAEEPDDLSNYISTYEGSDDLAEDFDKLREELREIEKNTGDDTCGLLVDEVFSVGSFFEKFVKSPGSDGPSYGKVGGLLASVVRISRHAFDCSKFYGIEEKEKAILLTAALLCRVGAADGYEFVDCMPCLTKRGILLGIPNLTMTRTSTALRRVFAIGKKEDKNVSQETILRIFHAITAANQTCGVKASTKEAMVLSGIVSMDSELVDALDFISSDMNKDEFTSFDPRLGRRYYKG